MGFLGISGKTWKKVGKIALKVAPIAAAPFTGGASLLALGAGTGAVSGALGGGGWKGALLGGALGAIPGGGAGGAAAGGVTKAGLKQLATGIGKGAATNFATGTGTGLATGQGLKQSLKGGGGSALSGLGTQGGAGGFKQAAKTVGKNVATNVGGQYASRGLQQAGVPGGVAAQGGNVFSQYLGNQFNPSPGGTSLVQQPAGQPAAKPKIGSYLPQQQQAAAPGGWQRLLSNAAQGALSGAQQGGGLKGALGGAALAAGGAPTQPTFPTNVPGGRTGGSPQAPDPEPAWEPQGPQPPAGQQAPAGGTAPVKAPTWLERYGPLIAQAGGVAVGGLVGKKAQENALKRSPEEQAALAGAQGAATGAGKLGGELAQQGRDYLQKPGQYFQTLLSGDRAAMSQAVAGPTAQLTGIYRGAERNLDQQGIRGAARDVAAGDLNRERASKLAGLTTGVQPYAAEQLAGMGRDTLAQAPGLYNTAGNIYGNLLGQGYNNRVYARKEGADTAAAIGGLARDAGEVVFRRPQAPGTPAPGTPAAKKPKKQGGMSQPPPTAPQTPTPIGQLPRTAPDVLGGATQLPVPVQTGTPNMPPAGYPFGTPGDYDPNRQWT